ncbi:hypothetical protein AWB78_06901 [Caballeronia calidae]|uniref:Uncharacterized protein n=1 Tax=Caballeronia calidae TaxID=1777139 RepID=A0A158EC65_9BURK|nr:hypothetical protein [Caballeronia calidae]SAL04310.1 hypothetical protein AWB78_06901 [Caballeronia calidae]
MRTGDCRRSKPGSGVSCSTSHTGKTRHLEVIEAFKEEDPKKASAAIRADIAEAAEQIREAIASQTVGEVESIAS